MSPRAIGFKVGLHDLIFFTWKYFARIHPISCCMWATHVLCIWPVGPRVKDQMEKELFIYFFKFFYL